MFTITIPSTPLCDDSRLMVSSTSLYKNIKVLQFRLIFIRFLAPAVERAGYLPLLNRNLGNWANWLAEIKPY